MVSHQLTISEFLAKSCQARPHNVGVVVFIDSSEESDNQQEPDVAITQEKTTCSSMYFH